MRLKRSFFERPTITVARALLGCQLVRRQGKRTWRGLVTETEAYVGPHDKASHASRGRTPRTAVMFGPAGHWYVYLIYGMYYCLNVVTEREGYPAAVLIRAVQPLVDKDVLFNGPGKVCRYFKIDRHLNNEDAVTSQRLWFEKDRTSAHAKILASPRLGVDYAGSWRHRLWRFSLVKR